MLVDVRVGVHEGYERVTLEFSGAGAPQYRVALADEPGSSECVAPEIDGSTFLNFVLPSSFQGPEPFEPAADSFDPARSVSIPEATRVTEVQVTCDFEGQLHLVIGLSDSYPYSISALTGPARLVVDFDDPSATPSS